MDAPPVGRIPPKARALGHRRPPAAARPSPCSLGALSRNDTEDVAGRLLPRLTAGGRWGAAGDALRLLQNWPDLAHKRERKTRRTRGNRIRH